MGIPLLLSTIATIKIKYRFKGETMGEYKCNRCGDWVEWKDVDVFHFKSVQKHHTLLSIQMCLKCRDDVFFYIETEVDRGTISEA